MQHNREQRHELCDGPRSERLEVHFAPVCPGARALCRREITCAIFPDPLLHEDTEQGDDEREQDTREPETVDPARKRRRVLKVGWRGERYSGRVVRRGDENVERSGRVRRAVGL